MDRQEIVKYIAVIDFALALLSMFYETMAVTFGEKRFFTEGINNNDNESSSEPSYGSELLHHNEGSSDLSFQPPLPSDHSTKFLAFILMVCVIFGLFLVQTFMAAKLFFASKGMRNKALAALQKFSCWRIWSCVFLFLLVLILITSVLVSLSRIQWTHWLLFSLLTLHIVFRAFGIYYVGLCRKDVKDGLVHPAFLIDAHRLQPPPPPPLHLQHHDL